MRGESEPVAEREGGHRRPAAYAAAPAASRRGHKSAAAAKTRMHSPPADHELSGRDDRSRRALRLRRDTATGSCSVGHFAEKCCCDRY